MGKYMKKSKITGDVAAMELSMGVRTRAKTLALQRLQTSSPAVVTPNPDTASYLQLRSRRLEKSPPPLFTDTINNKDTHQENPNCKASSEKIPVGDLCSNTRVSECKIYEAEQDFYDVGIEGSCGENNLEFEGRERSTRESTPCSFIRECNIIQTPGSSTRARSSTTTNQRLQERNIPTTQEIDDFFARGEQQQLRLFTEKYNFDFVNELPLQGSYDWVRLNP